ncbi:MAG: alanine--glyoxylate aminotransferase family protein [Chloroflexi bacterium]|nr:alanine--glyoxylate aminotransferase family protein [Chloroflexota bacterium]
MLEPEKTYTDLNTSARILLGPGPSMAHPRVLRAMATPLVGHLDPQFLQVMTDVQELLRYAFQTHNHLTIPVSGTGSAGMEAALCNFLEPGDRALVAVMGYFGERLVEMAARYGAQVERIDAPWGQVFDPQEVIDVLKQQPYKLLALVHAETSTGAAQPGIAEIAAAAHAQGTLVVLDTVTSLGTMPVTIDEWDVDVAYSGSQKGLSCPPGLAPLTVNERARAALRARKTPVANWYLDLMAVENYWGETRTYHHTAPISMNFALREGLRMLAEEGLEARWARHRQNAEALWTGLEDLDLPLLVEPPYRLPALTTPRLAPGIEDLPVRKTLLNEYNIEIAGGFGPLAGKVWRIGLMGHSSRKENVVMLLGALREILNR